MSEISNPEEPETFDYADYSTYSAKLVETQEPPKLPPEKISATNRKKSILEQINPRYGDLNITSELPKVADQSNSWDKVNKNKALVGYCKKHYQPMLKIIDQDFAKSCTRCLREAFLKKDQDELRASIRVDIGQMQEGFTKLKDEFGIRNNIKSEFCTFTTNIIQQSISELDAKYQKMRSKIVEKFEMKVLEQADQIEAFSCEFNTLYQLVESHAQINNRR